jgi:hypothetical protein
LRRLVEEAGFSVVLVGTAFPQFEVYPWLPAALIRWYRTHLPCLEKLPLVRRLGLSVFLLAYKEAKR